MFEWFWRSYDEFDSLAAGLTRFVRVRLDFRVREDFRLRLRTRFFDSVRGAFENKEEPSKSKTTQNQTGNARPPTRSPANRPGANDAPSTTAESRGPAQHQPPSTEGAGTKTRAGAKDQGGENTRPRERKATKPQGPGNTEEKKTAARNTSTTGRPATKQTATRDRRESQAGKIRLACPRERPARLFGKSRHHNIKHIPNVGTAVAMPHLRQCQPCLNLHRGTPPSEPLSLCHT